MSYEKSVLLTLLFLLCFFLPIFRKLNVGVRVHALCFCISCCWLEQLLDSKMISLGACKLLKNHGFGYWIEIHGSSIFHCIFISIECAFGTCVAIVALLIPFHVNFAMSRGCYFGFAVAHSIGAVFIFNNKLLVAVHHFGVLFGNSRPPLQCIEMSNKQVGPHDPLNVSTTN